MAWYDCDCDHVPRWSRNKKKMRATYTLYTHTHTPNWNRNNKRLLVVLFFFCVSSQKHRQIFAKRKKKQHTHRMNQQEIFIWEKERERSTKMKKKKKRKTAAATKREYETNCVYRIYRRMHDGEKLTNEYYWNETWSTTHQSNDDTHNTHANSLSMAHKIKIKTKKKNENTHRTEQNRTKCKEKKKYTKHTLFFFVLITRARDRWAIQQNIEGKKIHFACNLCVWKL